MSGYITNTIRQLRKRKGIKQRELAKMLGVSRQTVMAIEKGRWMPSLMLALKTARILQKSVEDIFKYHSRGGTP